MAWWGNMCGDDMKKSLDTVTNNINMICAYICFHVHIFEVTNLLLFRNPRSNLQCCSIACGDSVPTTVKTTRCYPEQLLSSTRMPGTHLKSKGKGTVHWQLHFGERIVVLILRTLIPFLAKASKLPPLEVASCVASPWNDWSPARVMLTLHGSSVAKSSFSDPLEFLVHHEKKFNILK